jgi:hypothetical protein
MRTSITALLVVLLAAPAGAAVVTVTDCVTDPHVVANVPSTTTRIDVGTDDLVLACGLAPLPGTDSIAIVAHDVTIQGPIGGITASGIGVAVQITASGGFTALSTSIESTATNGSMQITSAGDMRFQSSTVDVGGSTGGDDLRIECTNTAPACKIVAIDSTFESRLTFITAVGDIGFGRVHLVSHSPRDYIRVTSSHGNVDFSGEAAGLAVCCASGDPNGGNTVVTGNEGNLAVTAYGFVNMAFSNVLVAEFITITSGSAPGLAPVPAGVDLTGASIRNDFAKEGDIVVLADEAQATINISGAVLVDDNPTNSVQDVSELNGCTVVPRTSAPCVNIVGTPDLDN